MIAVASLSCEIGGVKALDAISFEAAAGEMIAIAGPSGAGKTTLFDVMSGVLRPTAGTVSLGGSRLDGMPPHRVAAHGVFRTHQPPRVFPYLTAMENVMAGTYRRPGRRAARTAAALAALERLGLGPEQRRLARTLDDAARRRLEVARAIAAMPSVLLLDEPFAGLDRDAKAAVVTALRELIAQSDATVLIAERDLADCAGVCASAVVLHAGSAIARGALEQVASEPDVRDAYLGVEWRQ